MRPPFAVVLQAATTSAVTPAMVWKSCLPAHAYLPRVALDLDDIPAATRPGDMSIPFPEDLLAEGNRRMGALCKMIGLSGIEDGSKVMLNMATAYAVVKVGMPLRIGLCLAATPWFARVAVVPVQTVFGKLRSVVASVTK
ncbi:hypothetical protein HDU88_003495 [Geranomyces variabilis]|nr:hypothetical protein HDU88_003495 [Geranomyces variabilis]